MIWDFTSACCSAEEYHYCCSIRYRRLITTAELQPTFIAAVVQQTITTAILQQIINTAVVHQTTVSLLLYCSQLFNTVFCIETQSMCPATPHTMCRTRQPRPVRLISIRLDGRDVAAVVSPSHPKHTQTELPSTCLPCSSFPHAPLGPLDLPVHFFK